MLEYSIIFTQLFFCDSSCFLPLNPHLRHCDRNPIHTYVIATEIRSTPTSLRPKSDPRQLRGLRSDTVCCRTATPDTSDPLVGGSAHPLYDRSLSKPPQITTLFFSPPYEGKQFRADSPSVTPHFCWESQGFAKRCSPCPRFRFFLLKFFPVVYDRGTLSEIDAQGRRAEHPHNSHVMPIIYL
jgi:hypothetical protein